MTKGELPKLLRFLNELEAVDLVGLQQTLCSLRPTLLSLVHHISLVVYWIERVENQRIPSH